MNVKVFFCYSSNVCLDFAHSVEFRLGPVCGPEDTVESVLFIFEREKQAKTAPEIEAMCLMKRTVAEHERPFLFGWLSLLVLLVELVSHIVDRDLLQGHCKSRSLLSCRLLVTRK